jgi:hypothetical protein
VSHFSVKQVLETVWALGMRTACLTIMCHVDYLMPGEKLDLKFAFHFYRGNTYLTQFIP